ncbi:hypothetical protein WG66_008478 [Moniliophthora roreri]|nr:hypothetical protein WG66_008478 [Moniliophthora roreri]
MDDGAVSQLAGSLRSKTQDCTTPIPFATKVWLVPIRNLFAKPLDWAVNLQSARSRAYARTKWLLASLSSVITMLAPASNTFATILSMAPTNFFRALS